MITKSDFLKYLTCSAYFWFSKKKPKVLEKKVLSDFQKELIKSGQDVEAWGRKLFPGGVLVESKLNQAVIDTKKFLDEGKNVVFQATFEAEGLYIMVDILEWDDQNNYWIINEAKGSTCNKENEGKNKKNHLYDAAFQYVVMQKSGYKIGKVNLIELNKEFIKDGEISPVNLLKVTNITDKILEINEEINSMIEDMRSLMKQETEPIPCDCIYKSRAKHCDAFSYLYPDMPDYTVHDIVRIGSSPKRLEGLVEGDYLSIYDVPEEFKLTDYQRNHVDVTQNKNTIIDLIEIKKELDKLEYPLYFLDYETFPTAVPIYDGCRPYQQMPFQYSLHIQTHPDADCIHHEFLHTDKDTHPMKALAISLMKLIGKEGTLIAWNKKFEKKCHEDIGLLLPEYSEIFTDYNERFYDLMDIFAKNLYVHHDFKGSYSIKAVLPVLAPELSYREMNISDGSMAMNSWKKMMFETEEQTDKDKIRDDLLKYCERDTYAMVKILEELRNL